MDFAPRSSISVDAYALRLTRRTQGQVAWHAILLVLLFAAAVARSGWRLAVIVLSVTLVLEAAVIGTAVGLGRFREDRRRRRGAYPSWTALASRSVAQHHHSHGDTDSRELGEALGRLSRTPTGYEWVARSLRDSRTGQFMRTSWPSDATVQTRRVWGLGQHGLVRFMTSDGADAILTVWRINDLDRDLRATAVADRR